MGVRRSLPAAWLGLLLVGTFGCTAPDDGQPTSLPSTRATTNSPAATATPHPVSIRALIEKQYDGRDLRLGRVLARNDGYTRYAVTYESGNLTISGIMNIPAGRGPYPVLVLAHGYIDPRIYTTGRGLAREQDYLARRGYAVLHTDYRNHAQSDDDPQNDLRLRAGYVEDVINAVLAVQGSSLPALDRDRMGLLGRSLGGGIVYNVLAVKPDLVDAAVAFAPVSANSADNFNHFIRRRPNRGADLIIAAYGAPESNPQFWRNASAINFFDRVNDPLLIHHGTADATCPIAWSRTALAALQREGKEARLVTYDGQGHTFDRAFTTSMRRTVDFFRAHLR